MQDSLEEYMKLWEKLNVLKRAGLTTLVDKLCDDMDVTWYKLTPEQRELFFGERLLCLPL